MLFTMLGVYLRFRLLLVLHASSSTSATAEPAKALGTDPKWNLWILLEQDFRQSECWSFSAVDWKMAWISVAAGPLKWLEFNQSLSRRNGCRYGNCWLQI